MNKIKRFTLVVGVLILINACKYSESKDIILDECFTGYFAIVFNTDVGENKNHKGDRIQIDIPKSRFQIVSYPRTTGIINEKFYLNNSDNKSNIISENPEDDCFVKNSLFVGISINDFEFEELERKNSLGIRYKYKTQFYFLKNIDIDVKQDDFDNLEQQIRKYLIDNNIKSRDSVVVENG